MSSPLSSTVKERVIQLHLEGKGRNQIAEILKLSHIRISQGSVTNILRTHKAGEAYYATIDFPKVSEPNPSPSQLPPTPMKEAQIPVSQGLAIHEEGQVQDQDQEESFMGWSMIFEQVMEIKKQRRELEQNKKELELRKMQVDRARYDLEIREIKLLEAEPLIPIARQLQDLGTDINQFLPWVETLHEKALAENLPTLTKAAYSLAQDLRMFRQLGDLKKNIELTAQQLEILNMSLQKQQQGHYNADEFTVCRYFRITNSGVNRLC